MKKNILFILMLCFVGFTACEYDNYDEPNAIISGRIVYQGNPVGVRTNGLQLELWQSGYDLYTSIPVHIAHDGTFSASVFNGQYKLVRKAGAPWEAQQSDTIRVEVRGNTVVEVPVTPYFVISNESFQAGSGSVTGNFTINKVVESANIESVKLYLSKSILTDENYKEHAEMADLATINVGSQSSITAQIPSSLSGLDYIFVRVGVRSTFSNEFYYTQVQKVNL